MQMKNDAASRFRSVYLGGAVGFVVRTILARRFRRRHLSYIGNDEEKDRQKSDWPLHLINPL